VLDTMRRESGVPLTTLRVDGGAAANDFLCQFQADVLGVEVLRPSVTETTGLGAAYLAGVGAGLWQTGDLGGRWKLERKFSPAMSPGAREAGYVGWRRAVERAREWIEPDRA
jgi:glycerol kinase